ncbi:hypothetical protein KBZ19_07940 [Synechococcus sp. L2F]|uniref:hypothetical protein n=1 Tax=Synechococcus sp. L2F TaxID=2823739 RepID=UPI0020CCAE4D|nr:hypothetical protein [Synechococcus sp. L2F]MCP9828418.1 hypothetical protein [Synechococcus sp. L2F]
MALILLTVYPAWAITQGQDANYDARNYHLYSSLAFLGGAYDGDLLPGGTQTFLNPLATLPAALLYYASQSLGPLLPTLLLALIQGATLVVVYAIGLRLLNGNRPMAFLAALMGGTAPLPLSEAGNTMADLTLSLVSVSALAFALDSASTEPVSDGRWRLALSAGLAGASVGMKLTFIVTIPLLLCVGLTSIGSSPLRKQRLHQLLLKSTTALLAFSISLALFMSPQFVQAYKFTGNPVFPMFNQYFRSPLHEDAHSSDDRFLPDSGPSFLMAPLHDFTDSFYAPFSSTMGLQTRRAEVLFRDMRPMLWIACSLIVLMLPVWRRRLNRVQIGFVLGLLSSYWFWLALAGIGRYAIPLQLLQGVAIALPFQFHHGFTRRFPSGLNGKVAFTLLLALTWVTQITPSWDRTGFEAHWAKVSLDSQPAVVTVRNGELQFVREQPIVLLQRPSGWIKSQSLESKNPLLNWDPGIAQRSAGRISKLPAVHARIEHQILASGFESVLAMSLSKSPTDVSKELNRFLVEAPLLRAAGFKPGSCSRYRAVNGGLPFSLCSVTRKSLQ